MSSGLIGLLGSVSTGAGVGSGSETDSASVAAIRAAISSGLIGLLGSLSTGAVGVGSGAASISGSD